MVTLQKKKARSGLPFKALKRQKLVNLPGAGIGTVVDIHFLYRTGNLPFGLLKTVFSNSDM